MTLTTGSRRTAAADRFVYTSATESPSAAADVITDFEIGVDKIDLTALGAVQVSFTNYVSGGVTLSITSGGIVIFSLRVMAQATASDLVHGALHGSVGDEKLEGSAGSDTIHGQAGNDRLLGQAGDDWLSGGADSDVLAITAADGFVLMLCVDSTIKIIRPNRIVLTEEVRAGYRLPV